MVSTLWGRDAVMIAQNHFPFLSTWTRGLLAMGQATVGAGSSSGLKLGLRVGLGVGRKVDGVEGMWGMGGCASNAQGREVPSMTAEDLGPG